MNGPLDHVFTSMEFSLNLKLTFEPDGAQLTIDIYIKQRTGIKSVCNSYKAQLASLTVRQRTYGAWHGLKLHYSVEFTC